MSKQEDREKRRKAKSKIQQTGNEAAVAINKTRKKAKRVDRHPHERQHEYH